ncbi:glycosyltransferase family 39 protein [candidate division WOR-3 bacterium]|nr:glycosyltransferase family 39 protein [candidate division WOR-3 bacterium]
MKNKNRVIKNLLLGLILFLILYYPINFLIKYALDTFLDSGTLNASSINNVRILSENFVYFYILFACIVLLVVAFKDRFIRLFGKISSINIVIILLFALLVRILWVIIFPTGPVSDFKEYNSLALGFAETNSFPYPSIPFLPVGSIFIFASIYKLFGTHLIFIKFFHIILSLLTIILFYKISDKLFGKETAKIFIILYSFYPAHISMINITSPAVIMTFLFALFIYIFVSSKEIWYKYLILGVVGGALLYIKPVFIFAMFVPFIYNFTIRNYLSVLNSLLVPIFALLVILPFSLHYGHFFIVNTNGGINFLVGNNENATGTYFSPSQLEELNRQQFNVRTPKGNQECIRLTKNYILKNPLKFISLVPKRLFYLLFKDTGSLSLSFLGLKINSIIKWILYIINSIYYYLIMLTGIFSLRWRNIKRDFKGYLILLSFILSVVVVFMVSVGVDKYKYPFMPLIMILSSFWIFQLLKKEDGGEEFYSPNKIRNNMCISNTTTTAPGFGI